MADKESNAGFKTKRTHGTNDVAEKILLNRNEVFADVVNGCLFDGRRAIKAGMLENAQPESAFTEDGSIHSEYRDVSKYLNLNGKTFRIMLIGIENQSHPDRRMAARTLCYDAAGYIEQFSQGARLYPVVTIVLYYGKEKWNYPQNLLGELDLKNVPCEIKDRINDYQMRAFFDIGHMPIAELRRRFKSAFYFVAEYFSQINRGEEAHPSQNKVTIKDARLVLRMLKAMSGGDPAFEEVINSIAKKNENEVETMGSILTPYYQHKLDNAVKKNSQEVKEKETITYAKNVMKSLNLPAEKALELLGVPEADRPKYLQLLQAEKAHK
jgi:hypothetical protein